MTGSKRSSARIEGLPDAQRSANMRAVRGKDTTPEMIVRRMVHRMGYRFRLHRKDLPGRPDLVLPRLSSVILVNGCFWHRHEGCRRATLPKANSSFWREKLERNADRDRSNVSALESAGWKVLVIWECEVKERSRLETMLGNFLRPSR
jgi:DNA mismatch endonuclease, patch repair protein